MELRNLLVCTDFSDSSDYAVKYACELACKLEAKITLVHAFGVPVYPVADGAVIAPPNTIAEITATVNAQLAKMRVRLVEDGLAIETRCVQGPAAEAICELCTQEGFDLVVVGTHGRSGLSRLLLGSVAEEVLRHAPIPCLTVRSQAASE